MRLGRIELGRRRLWAAGAVLAAVGVLAALLGYGLHTGPTQRAESMLVGRAAPRLTGRTLDGSTFRLDSLRGHVTLVNVWASWCAPCQSEMPLLAKTARTYRSAGLRVATIDTRDGVGQARDFLRKVGAERFASTSVRDPDGAFAVAWGATGAPETYLVDAQGVVRARRIGVVTPRWLAAHLVPMLETR